MIEIPASGSTDDTDGPNPGMHGGQSAQVTDYGNFRIGDAMVNWHRFAPRGFEYDFDHDKLAAHGVTFEEAVQCFFSDFEVRRNKHFGDRFQLIGRTVAGRRLKVIFQLRPDTVVRIITGWPI